VKAVNYLLPHIQRIPSRIVRDELAQEIAQKLAIDSAVLRQELRHTAAARSSAAIKGGAELQVTDAERILIRALASARQMQSGEQHLSARDGAEEEFDPARQARFALESEGLHRGLATESLIEALLNAPPEVADVMEVPQSESDRRLLASILLKEEETLSAEALESAVRALRRVALDRRREEIKRALDRSGSMNREEQIALAEERARVKLARRTPESPVGGKR